MSPIITPLSSEYAPYYERYIKMVHFDLLTALQEQMEQTLFYIKNWTEEEWLHSYATHKWTAKESFLHLLDTERIFAYRALRISRGDTTPIPGFDQDTYVPNSYANQRTSDSLIQEYQFIRQATIVFFQHLNQSTFTLMGTASEHPLSVRAAGFIIAGHELHHIKLFKEKYFPKN